MGGTSDRMITQAAYSLVDVDFLREILNNLVENAIKYTKEGGGIWINVRGDGDRVLVNVTDTGIGISPDDLLHIFQKFYRVDNSQTREIGGTGLGLYIVKMRAEAMGGKVWAESSFGEGSTFYLSLPRLTFEEYERRKQIQANTNAMNTNAPTTEPATAPVAPNPASASGAGDPISISTIAPESAPATPVTPEPTPNPAPATPELVQNPEPTTATAPVSTVPAPKIVPSPGDGIIQTP